MQKAAYKPWLSHILSPKLWVRWWKSEIKSVQGKVFKTVTIGASVYGKYVIDERSSMCLEKALPRELEILNSSDPMYVRRIKMSAEVFTKVWTFASKSTMLQRFFFMPAFASDKCLQAFNIWVGRHNKLSVKDQIDNPQRHMLLLTFFGMCAKAWGPNLIR